MESYYEDCRGHRWVDEDGIFTDEPHSCVQCGKPTHRTDINFEAAVHGGDCLNSLWNEYWEALRKSGPIQWTPLS